MDGWQPSDWSAAGSGLGVLFPPETLAQIDFGDRQGSGQTVQTAGDMPAMAASHMVAQGKPVSSTAVLSDSVSGSAPRDGLALDTNGNVMVERVEVTPRVNTQRLAQILGTGEGNYESYNTGTRGVRGGRVGHSYLNPPSGTVTGRTISQILNTEGLSGTDPNRMFAVGAYQISIPTLKGATRALKLTGNERLTPELQDRIFSEFLIPEAGDGALGNLLNKGEGTVDQAQLAAARRWVGCGAGGLSNQRSQHL